MFGLKKRVWTEQFSRAATVENWVKAGIYDYLITSHEQASGSKASDFDLALFAGAAHYIVAWDIQKQLEMLKGHSEGAETIRSIAHQILASDSDLERLVVRLLYEIESLGLLLGRDERVTKYLHNHPRIRDVLAGARTRYPELFRDVEEIEFKTLFRRFMEKYVPAQKESVQKLFG
jgi:hypothetical protein